MTTPALDDRKLQELEQKFDPEMRFRPLAGGGHHARGRRC
jgi:hypothetical protein